MVFIIKKRKNSPSQLDQENGQNGFFIFGPEKCCVEAQFNVKKSDLPG